MPWRERSLVSVRQDFILRALTREVPIAELCRHFGVSRKTAYKWLKRFRERGTAGLVDRPRRPRSNAKALWFFDRVLGRYQRGDRTVQPVPVDERERPWYTARQVARSRKRNRRRHTWRYCSRSSTPHDGELGGTLLPWRSWMYGGAQLTTDQSRS